MICWRVLRSRLKRETADAVPEAGFTFKFALLRFAVSMGE
jgi:hypothetical protein